MGIEQTCLQDLAKVPYVKGVNNHMDQGLRNINLE